jgi:hypothetical protein
MKTHLIPDIRSWFENGYSVKECAMRFQLTEREVIDLLNWKE